MSCNFNFRNKRSQSFVEVAIKLIRLGGHGKIASATLEKTTTDFMTPIARRFLTRQKL